MNFGFEESNKKKVDGEDGSRKGVERKGESLAVGYPGATSFQLSFPPYPFPFTRSGFSSGFYAAFRAKLRRKSKVLSGSLFYFS